MDNIKKIFQKNTEQSIKALTTDKIIDTPIFDYELELDILANIAFNPKVQHKINILSEADFYSLETKKIYKCFKKVFNQKNIIDISVIGDKNLSYRSLLGRQNTVLPSQLDLQIEKLKEKTAKRTLQDISYRITVMVVEDRDVEEIKSYYDYEIAKIGLDSNVEITTEDIDNELERYLTQKELPIIKTGLPHFDRTIGGFMGGTYSIIASAQGIGKCLGKGTKILMYNGTLKKVENVKVGDLLMGDDSTPRQVLSLGQGREMMYFVKQQRGITYRVNKSHVLSLKKNIKRGSRGGKGNIGDILNVPLYEFIEWIDEYKNRYWKGYKVPVNFPKKSLPIDPYFLGLWLGDGDKNTVRITTMDKEIINFLEEYAFKNNWELSVIKSRNRCNSYSIRRIQRKGPKEKSLQYKLRKLGVIGNKYIPKMYLINSRENRLKLLAGLIDSDGYCSKGKNGTYGITQKSKKIATQIKFLCDTLGLFTSIRSKIKGIKSINYTAFYHIVHFNGDVDKIPIKVKRKKANKWTLIENWRFSKLKIKKDKIDDYYGFEIDGNGLFLLEDMTVTHNTTMMINLLTYACGKLDKKVLYIPLEMSYLSLQAKIISNISGVEFSKMMFRMTELNNDEWTKIHNARATISKFKISRLGQGNISTYDIRTRLKEEKDIDMVMIDYMQLLKPVLNGRSQYETISNISREIKILANEFNIPFVVISSINRDYSDRADYAPHISDLRGSGTIEFDADLVLLLHRLSAFREHDIKKGEIESEFKHRAELIIAKNRFGESNLKIELYFDGGKSLLKEMVKKGITYKREIKDESSTELF